MEAALTLCYADPRLPRVHPYHCTPLQRAYILNNIPTYWPVDQYPFLYYTDGYIPGYGYPAYYNNLTAAANFFNAATLVSNNYNNNFPAPVNFINTATPVDNTYNNLTVPVHIYNAATPVDNNYYYSDAEYSDAASDVAAAQGFDISYYYTPSDVDFVNGAAHLSEVSPSDIYNLDDDANFQDDANSFHDDTNVHDDTSVHDDANVDDDNANSTGARPIHQIVYEGGLRDPKCITYMSDVFYPGSIYDAARRNGVNGNSSGSGANNRNNTTARNNIVVNDTVSSNSNEGSADNTNQTGVSHDIDNTTDITDIYDATDDEAEEGGRGDDSDEILAAEGEQIENIQQDDHASRLELEQNLARVAADLERLMSSSLEGPSAQGHGQEQAQTQEQPTDVISGTDSGYYGSEAVSGSSASNISSFGTEESDEAPATEAEEVPQDNNDDLPDYDDLEFEEEEEEEAAETNHATPAHESDLPAPLQFPSRLIHIAREPSHHGLSVVHKAKFQGWSLMAWYGLPHWLTEDATLPPELEIQRARYNSAERH
ncbi:hypothetical protein K4F52_000389 [Lecanicillium sp. MT-2017a]|nr:hypothetical protein K4F52_000389 [Lecanicillium sp. MT-2017a]